MNETMRPFYSGTQYLDWQCANCDRCAKQAPADAGLDEMPCEIEAALVLAAFDGGMVPLSIAQRMAAVENRGRYGWQCGEFEAKEGT